MLLWIGGPVACFQLGDCKFLVEFKKEVSLFAVEDKNSTDGLYKNKKNVSQLYSVSVTVTKSIS